jgi:hypothetical protein
VVRVRISAGQPFCQVWERFFDVFLRRVREVVSAIEVPLVDLIEKPEPEPSAIFGEAHMLCAAAALEGMCSAIR